MGYIDFTNHFWQLYQITSNLSSLVLSSTALVLTPTPSPSAFLERSS